MTHPPPKCTVAEDFGSQVAIRLNVTKAAGYQCDSAVELYLIAKKQALEGSQTRCRGSNSVYGLERGGARSEVALNHASELWVRL